jgi:hypothetical protein
MSRERPELKLVRESLEAVVAPTVASAVVFEALEANGGRLPEGPAAARAFVDGPLRHALKRRLGENGDPIIDELIGLLATLAPAPAAPSPPSSSAPAPQSRGRPDTTQKVPSDRRPVTAIIVASSERFAAGLRAALGTARVVVLATHSLEQLIEQVNVAPPAVVVIDAADFPEIEPDTLGSTLEHLPKTAVRAIWGADLPYGTAVLRALLDRSIPATPLDRREGMAPLLDLLRSRLSVS